jgi:hypothetical protein
MRHSADSKRQRGTENILRIVRAQCIPAGKKGAVKIVRFSHIGVHMGDSFR